MTSSWESLAGQELFPYHASPQALKAINVVYSRHTIVAQTSSIFQHPRSPWCLTGGLSEVAVPMGWVPVSGLFRVDLRHLGHHLIWNTYTPVFFHTKFSSIPLKWNFRHLLQMKLSFWQFTGKCLLMQSSSRAASDENCIRIIFPFQGM